MTLKGIVDKFKANVEVEVWNLDNGKLIARGKVDNIKVPGMEEYDIEELLDMDALRVVHIKLRNDVVVITINDDKIGGME